MIRFFDVLLSVITLLLLLRILPIVILLRFTGEDIFLQERIGKDGKKFELFKFATMLKNSPDIGTGTVTMKNDPKVLPLGRFLRKTKKINELPQLLNIFFGDMSVIGPRPLTPQAFDTYSDITKCLIKKVRPGLSGIGSIVFRAEEEILHGASGSIDFYENVIAPYKGELEEWFVSNKSLYIYFVAIFVTAGQSSFPNTKIVWRSFKDLPEPPNDLKQALNLLTNIFNKK